MMAEKGALFGKYEVGRLLGCGAFAKVYYARNISNNGQPVAIKVINKKKMATASSSLITNIKREITIMRRLRHPNIVRLYEVLATRTKIYFVLELVKGGELFAKVAKGRFGEDLARKYFRQLVSAVAYCHSRGVYHRDLKPENLLVDEDGNLKVSDFGLSAFVCNDNNRDGGDMLQTLCGTPAYVAPEILAKKGYDGAKVDVWSCGVILYVLTAGYLPFNDPNLMAMYKKIYKGEFKCPKWMSSDLKRFLSRLLDTNPNTRITIDQIMRDPWFAKGGGVVTGNLPFFDDVVSMDDSHLDKDREALEPASGPSTSASCPVLDSCMSLNAFDLISYSSGLDLSALFDESFNPVVDAERFLSEQPVDEIVGQIEEAARAESIHVRKNNRKKDAFGVDLEGGIGNAHFSANMLIRSLTDQLLMVEVKKRCGNSNSFNSFWSNKIRPRLLVHHPDKPPTNEE